MNRRKFVIILSLVQLARAYEYAPDQIMLASETTEPEDQHLPSLVVDNSVMDISGLEPRHRRKQLQMRKYLYNTKY